MYGCDVFTTAASETEGGYAVQLVSPAGGMVSTDCGVGLESVGFERVVDTAFDTVMVAGGEGVFTAISDPDLLAWVRAQSATVRRIGSTCIGAFLLAAAGLLDGRRATTHWRWAGSLQRRFPNVDVDPDAIYIEDRGVWTSAGVSAGIDLSLAMVERDFGHDVALEVARRLVIPLKRAGGQSQFSSTLALQSADRDGAFDQLHTWIGENLQTDLNIERLAEVYGRSTRTFVRHYKAATGTTPAKAVERMRVDAARNLLERNGIHLGRVASRCGFDNVETMRRSFVRCLGIAPAAYRARFGTNGSGAGRASRGVAQIGT